MSYQGCSTIKSRQKTYQSMSYVSGWMSVRTVDINIWFARKEVLVKMVKKPVISIFLKIYIMIPLILNPVNMSVHFSFLIKFGLLKTNIKYFC